MCCQCALCVVERGEIVPHFSLQKRTMFLCPSPSMTTSLTFSDTLRWRRGDDGTRRRRRKRRKRRFLNCVARGGERGGERDAFGERDVLKRLTKLKRAVAQNRTKDTVPTAETIGMRFSEVLLQSCSIRIYVVVVVRPRREVVVAREFVFLPFSNSLFSWRRGILLFSIGVVSLTARCFSLLYYVQ